jgi:UDP-N-acetyl-2-amino-2-deoxyglucuronate dehydrogenase
VTLRIGIVGTGIIAWAHGLGLQAMIRAGVIDAEISAVFDVRERRAQRFAEGVGSRAAASVDEVVERADAVWICTPTDAHPALVDAVITASRAVFCEKPLATDLAQAEAMAAAVAASGVPAQVGLVLRSSPVFRALRDIVASGEIGTPMAAVFRDDQYFPIQGLYASTWRSDVTVAGGGCLIEHSIHDLDILRFCLGEVTSITGRINNLAGHEGVEDVATASIHFASGATANLVSVWHGILSRGSTRRVEVFCQQGLAWFDNDFIGPLHVETSTGIEMRPCPPPAWVDALPFAQDEVGLAVRPYVEADRAFVDAVTNATTAAPSFEEAVIAHRLVDAVYRSASAAAGDEA